MDTSVLVFDLRVERVLLEDSSVVASCSSHQRHPHLCLLYVWNPRSARGLSVLPRRVSSCLFSSQRLNVVSISHCKFLTAFHPSRVCSNCKRIGPQAWLLIGSIATEVLIIFKFGQGEFPNPAPAAVIYFWIAFLTLLTAYPTYQFYLLPKWQEKNKEQVKAKTA